MKIVLMAPAGAMHRYNGTFSRSLHYAPLTLTTLAALVPLELDATIQLIDETVEKIPLDIEADIIGMTVITGTSMRCYRYADYYRAKGIFVVLGGVHVSLLPEEALQHADAIVTGFAEESWPQLLRDFKNNCVQKKYQQSGKGITLPNLKPRTDLLRKRRYITTNTVEAIRGCHHKCNFCVIPTALNGQVLNHEISGLIKHIESLPGKYILFADANLITDIAFAKAFFKALAPLKKKWFGLVTSLVIKNEELFNLIIKSGCKGLLIGFESVTNASLSAVNKNFQHETDYEELVKKLHDNGVAINGTFVFGNDEDDESVFERTVERIQKLKIDLPRYSIYTPFPGTPLYKKLLSEDRIIESDWSAYDVEHCVIVPKKMSPEKLQSGLEWAWHETYKASNIFSRISGFHSRFLIDLPLNIGYKNYGRNLPKFTIDKMKDHSDIPTL
jgi:radical SAM superfamily enzyme YgiQ (UPF0313 family)